MSRLRGIAVGLLVGGLVLALLFAGQVLSFAAFWLGRVITGTVILLLALGLGYAAYELSSGWSQADGSQSTTAEWDAETESIGGPDTGDDTTLSDEELEEELDVLREETEELEEDVVSETN